MPHYIVGHVGDGNFHIAYLVDPNKPEERETAERLNDAAGACARWRWTAPAAASTASACTRWASWSTEAGAGAVDMMRTIKRALDPKNIMNPGKIFAL